MNIYRGSVWWWHCPEHLRPHIQEGTRPVVVVSNDTCNYASSVVTVVPFTTKIKKAYPQQVPIIFNGNVSIALADQITSIPVSELGDYICMIPNWQLDQIDRAIEVQLGFVDVDNGSYVSNYEENEGE